MAVPSRQLGGHANVRVSAPSMQGREVCLHCRVIEAAGWIGQDMKVHGGMPIAHDGSVTSSDGRLIFCSVERFVRDICVGSCCFVCGRSEREVRFNREHILPNWLLHRFNLHKETVTLPNGVRHRYGTYTLPCCVDCNSEMSRIFETPISEAVGKGFQGVDAMLRDGGGFLLFQWLVLVYLKYHLKDRLLQRHRDDRKGKEPISADYEWKHFHHLHSVARAHYTGAELGSHVVGSLIVMQAADLDQAFDAATVTDASTIYLQLGDVLLFAVLNDAQASVSGIDQILERIDGPLNRVQARELAAELAAANLHLENRPQFRSLMLDKNGSGLVIEGCVDGDGPVFLDRDDKLVGYIKCGLLQQYFGHVVGLPAEEVERRMRENHFTFLWDAEGRLQKTEAQSREA